MSLSDLVIPPWIRWAAAAGLFTAGFGAGFQVESWRWSASELHAVKKQDKTLAKKTAQQSKEATTYEHDRETGRQENAARQTEIRTIYRDRPVPADCAAPDSVRGLLDSAVNAANARAAGQPGATVPAATEPARRADRP